MWKAFQNAIPCKENLAKKGLNVDSNCLIGAQEIETTEHYIFWCPFARATWFISPCAYKPSRWGFLPLLIGGLLCVRK